MEVEAQAKDVLAAPNKEAEPQKDALDSKETEQAAPINKEGAIDTVSKEIPDINGILTEKVSLSSMEGVSQVDTSVYTQSSDTSFERITVFSSQEEAALLKGEKSDEIELHVSLDGDQILDPDVEMDDETDMENTLIAVAAIDEEKNNDTVIFSKMHLYNIK